MRKNSCGHKVLRGLFAAESGRSGGGQINVVTRSGASKFHGSAFEFLRNEVLNANDFLTNSALTPHLGETRMAKRNARHFATITLAGRSAALFIYPRKFSARSVTSNPGRSSSSSSRRNSGVTGDFHPPTSSAQHNFTETSQVVFAYTWAKNLTSSPNDRTTSPQNSYDIGSEYQRATLDRRHVLSINYIYELPFFRTQQGFAGKALGGWQVSGIAVYNTGLPFTATTSNLDYAGLGLINANPAARPNLLYLQPHEL